MKKYIALFREPDGRIIKHSDKEIIKHQENWGKWFEKWVQKGNLDGGSGLTLNGRIVKEFGNEIFDHPHTIGTEIIGGFILLSVKDMDEATEIIKSCPIYEFGGYVEIRELQNQ